MQDDTQNIGPTVTYTFDYYNHRDELKTFQQASDMQMFIWDFQMYLRQIWKYEELPDEVYKKVDEIYEKFFEMKNERSIEDPT